MAYTILPLDIGVMHIPFTLGCVNGVYVFLFTYLFKFCF